MPSKLHHCRFLESLYPSGVTSNQSADCQILQIFACADRVICSFINHRVHIPCTVSRE